MADIFDELEEPKTIDLLRQARTQAAERTQALDAMIKQQQQQTKDIFDEVSTKTTIGTKAKVPGVPNAVFGTLTPDQKAQLQRGDMSNVIDIPASAQAAQQPAAAPQQRSSSIFDTAASVALPTAGSYGGAALGAALGGPPGAVVGEVLGSVGGEAASQMAGFSEPSLTQLGLAAVGGPLTRGAAALGRNLLVRPMAKMFAGRPVVAQAAEQGMKKMLLPGEPAEQIFNRVTANQTVIPTGETQTRVVELLADEAKRANTPVKKEIVEALKPLQRFFGAPAGTQPMSQVNDLFEESKRLRSLADEAYKKGKTQLGNKLSEVRAAMFRDFEQSGVTEVRQAAARYRREQAVEKLGSIAGKPEALTKYREALKQDKLFAGTFNDADQAQIEKILKRVGTVSPSGFAGVVGRSILGTAVGSQAGLGAGIAAATLPDMIGSALATKTGRNYLEKLLVGGTGFDAPKAAAFTQFMRAYLADLSEGQEQP